MESQGGDTQEVVYQPRYETGALCFETAMLICGEYQDKQGNIRRNTGYQAVAEKNRLCSSKSRYQYRMRDRAGEPHLFLGLQHKNIFQPGEVDHRFDIDLQ